MQRQLYHFQARDAVGQRLHDSVRLRHGHADLPS